ncbi:hypothetical protein MUG87_02610 [Ectobacillus sp. JY-23]|uniref:hypothetical protein n=1 Tax=Ectobacillus sp. JY-23 TaxID=2933872 RepID=UPI001FF27DE8|nr:hypothetical protein [Ectobacillus sp. JY-23]UOY93046.1 hypothetical protein MUG87_02610 [Ectobacillus sp. JY-23]
MNKKAILIPVCLLICIFSLLYYEHIKIQTALPSKDWSRSFFINLQSDMPLNAFVRSDSDYHVYTLQKNNVLHTVLNENMDIKTQYVVNVRASFNSRLWGKDEDIMYIHNGELQFSNGKDVRTIAQDVVNFRSLPESVLYWKEKELYEVKSDGPPRLLTTFNYKIKDVVLEPNGQSVLVVLENEQVESQLMLVTQDGQVQTLPSLTMSGTEKVEEFQFVREGNDLQIFYVTLSLAQGIKTYRAYEWNVTSGTKQAEQRPVPLQLYSKEGIEFSNPRYLQVRKEEELTLLFTAFGQTAAKEENFNVYEAKKQGGKWVSQRISTTDGVASYPIRFSDKEVMWTAFSGKTYTMAYASQDRDLIDRSEQIVADDWKDAMYGTFTSLFSGIIMMLLSISWLIIPTILYVIVYFFRTDELEQNKLKWIDITLIGLYTLSQFVFFAKVFKKDSLYYAPDYLTFTGSNIILPIALGLVVWVLMKWVKGDEWSSLQRFSYYASVNIVALSFLFGPFML